jgi:hypothetical protein
MAWLCVVVMEQFKASLVYMNEWKEHAGWDILPPHQGILVATYISYLHGNGTLTTCQNTGSYSGPHTNNHRRRNPDNRRNITDLSKLTLQEQDITGNAWKLKLMHMISVISPILHEASRDAELPCGDNGS